MLSQSFRYNERFVLEFRRERCPQGIIYNRDKGRVQTFEVNSFFTVIPEIARLVAKMKNGNSLNLEQIAALVTLTRFKLVTAGAEIQCAIQLRHRAFFGL